jgi:hypothetical protein
MMFTLIGAMALNGMTAATRMNSTIEYMNIKHSTRLEWIA